MRRAAAAERGQRHTKLRARWPAPPRTAQEPDDAEVANVAWDLEPLVHGEGEAGVRALLDEAAERAEAFAAAHAGRVAELDADGLRAAMEELAALHELVGRAGSYASLRFAVDTADPARGALLQHVQERAHGDRRRALLFFELEWAALDDAQRRGAAGRSAASPSARTTCAASAATGRIC